MTSLNDTLADLQSSLSYYEKELIREKKKVIDYEQRIASYQDQIAALCNVLRESRKELPRQYSSSAEAFLAGEMPIPPEGGKDATDAASFWHG